MEEETMTKQKYAVNVLFSAERAIASTLVLAFLLLIVVWTFILGDSRVAADTLVACPTDLFLSEYIEGSSYNKALEIYNGTGNDITLTGHYSVYLSFNGGSSERTIDLVGTVADNDVFILADDDSTQTILNQADQTDTGSFFNGDDAVVLYHNGVIIDVIGKIGEDPGDYWGSEPNTTKDHTLVRKSSIMDGDTDGSDPFDPAAEWDSYAQNTFTYLGSHTIDPCGELPVGGVTYPNNPVHLLMPWASLVVLAGLILAAGTMAIRKRTG
ncbi:MAG: hypothetical protein DRI80_05695 [Chloroflexota bacterium]|nr:MAG: hypothetical protein DRI80_05695 [Chloroflexota bacterium]